MHPGPTFLVSILVIKMLSFQLTELHVDPSRNIIIHTLLRGKVSLYPYAPFIILRDFNATLSHAPDTLHPPQAYNKALHSWAQAHNLTELWQWLHPETRQLFCFLL